MRSGVDHLSEVDLIRFQDGEMSSEEAALASSHLEECKVCRTSLEETLQMGEDLKIAVAGPRPTRDENKARNLLQAKLAEASGEQDSPWARLRGFRAAWFTKSYVCGGAAFAGIVAILFGMPNLHRSVAELAASLPNRALTPGMTRPVNVEEVCAAGDDDLDPKVPYSRQQAVFSEYGISIDHSAKDFQVDYLISPQLGGTDDVRNLWPQSYKETTWNAEAKDALERHLYRLVCDKKINLADAQREIATNWITAYQKYFRTGRPG
jgi:hypothetical protein